MHRALDTTGALLGPLVAFGLLALAPLAFDSVFLVSLLLRGRRRGDPGAVRRPQAARAGRRRPGAPRVAEGSFRAAARPPLPGAAGRAAGALSLATASDAFIFLALQRKLDLGATMFPLLFVGSAGAYMLLAVPMGRLADRVGRGRVLLLGYALLLGVYAVLLAPIGGWALLRARRSGCSAPTTRRPTAC